MGESKDTRRRAARGDDAPVEDGVDGEDHQMEDATEDSIDRLAFKTNFNLSRTIKPIYTGGVARIDPSSEARLYSTVGTDIHVMDLETGLEALTLKGEADDITCFAIKPNGKHLVAASRSLLIKCYDLQTGEAIRTWKAHEAPVLTMAFDATSTLVATGSADSTTKVWDVDRGHATHNLKGHSGVISALSFWNDLGGVKKKGKKDRRTSTGGSVRLATSSDDRKINLWDLNTKSIIVTLDSHASVVRGLAFSFDGRFLVSGGRDKILNLWDLQEQALVSTLPTHEGIEALGILDRSAVEGMDGLEADVDSGLFVYTGGESGVLKVWDMTSLTCVAQQEPEKNSKHEIMDCFHLKSRNALISITSDQNILFHDLTSTHLPRSHQIVGCNEEILDVCFLDPRDSTLAVASNSEQIRCYNLNGSGCEILCGHEETVVCLARSKDGRWLASGGKDRRCMIWHQGVKEKWPRAVGDCVGHTGAVGALAFSQKTHSFVLSGSEDRTIKCWDLTPLTGKEKTGVRLHTRFTFVAHDRDINAIVVAPNDKCFATGSQDKTAKVWSTVDGSLMGTCKGHRRGVWAVDFSPVDQVLATSSGDKTIKLWSVADFSCLKTFEGHLNSVLKLRFLSLGAQLVSSGSDGLVKLWTIKSGECAGTFDNHEDK
ncbi:Transducin (beta)-like 3, partial [Irineochytrium annulatum]